jgi:hypothetical protein
MPKIKSTKLPSAKEVWEEAKDLTEELVEAGSDEDKAVKAVADFLDAILPLDKLIPGELGDIAEDADGMIFEEIVARLAKLVKVDPAKQAERRARRKEKQSTRRAKRIAKKAERAARKAAEEME